MSGQTLYPTAIAAAVGLFGTVAAIDDDPAAPDADWVTVTDAPKWYVRPAGGSYGAEDGTSYEAAWEGFAAIQWASIQPGDTLYVAGTHYAQASNFYAFEVGAAGVSGSPITIASCEIQYGASTDDAGTIYGGRLWDTGGWTGPTNGVYSRSTPATFNQFGLEADHTVLVRAADLAECEATPGSLYMPAETGTITLYYHPTAALQPLIYFGASPLRIQRDYVTVRGLRAFYAASTNGAVVIQRDAYAGVRRGVTVTECEVAYSINAAVNLTGSDAEDIVFSDNVVYDCSSGFYPLSQPGAVGYYHNRITVERNEFYHTAQIEKRGPFYDSPGDECAIATQGGADHFMIRDNYIHDWHGEGIFLFQGGLGGTMTCNDATIVRNRVLMNSTEAGRTRMGICLGGFEWETDRGKRVLIANNLITGSTYSSTSIGNNWCAALRLKPDKPTDPNDRMRVYNNTVVGAYYGIYAVPQTADVAFGGDFKNNIIVDPDTDGWFVHHGNDLDQSGIELNYNCYHGTGKFTWDAGTATTSFATWKSNTGNTQDANSITGDPLFTGASDYTLQSGSPCVNAGTDTDLTDDLAGNPRPVGAYDIGAYERQ